MKHLLLTSLLLLFLLCPESTYSQVKTKQSLKTERKKPTKRTIKKDEKIRTVKTEVPVRAVNQDTSKLMIVNNRPVKLKKVPVLSPSRFKFVSALKKANLSDSRDRTDNTQLETTGSNATNYMNITESGTKKENNCYVTTKTLDITTADFSYFTESSAPDFIKPGVVINYQSILDGRNTINTTPRNPMMIYLINTSAIPGLDQLSVDIADPQNISGINNALGNLTGKLNTKSVPANMSFEIMEINSEKQLQYAVTGSYSYGSMVSAKFGVSGGNYSNSYYYLIKFTQNMYNVAADPNTVSFINIPNNADQLAYVSEVTYGRKGLMMIKTNKSMSQIKAEMEVSANYGLHKGDIGGFIKSVNLDSNSEIRVFFYGGSSSVAARSLQASDMRKGFDKWVEAEAGNGLLALPISYKVKNLKGEQLKISSVFKQEDRDCVPRKKLKLKVTLLEIDGWNTTDSDDKGDYAVIQHVRYTANNKVKPGNVSYNTFKKNTPCNLAGNKKWNGAIALACGSMKDQIHVSMNSGNHRRSRNNIKNSVIFEVSPEEANDKSAKFEVETWVKEYSTNWRGNRDDILMNNDFVVRQEIPIPFVLAELQGISKGSFDQKYAKDNGLHGKIFNNFGNEYVAMTKTEVNDINKTYLDAVFRARNSGDLKEKAFLYLRFELID